MSLRSITFFAVFLIIATVGPAVLYVHQIPCSPVHRSNTTIVLDSDATACSVPVLLLSFNNPTLFRLLVDQLRTCFNASVTILDNGSTYEPMITYLRSLSTDPHISVHFFQENFGPHVLFGERGAPIMKTLPQHFVLADSDIKLSDFTPKNFICVLARLTDVMHVPKAALALDLSDHDEMFPQETFYPTVKQSIYTHERSLYQKARVDGWPIINATVYHAETDTTFAVYIKQFLTAKGDGMFHFAYRAVRVGSIFAAKHRPWCPKVYGQLADEEINAMFSGEGTMKTFREQGRINLRGVPNTTVDSLQSNDLMAYVCGGNDHIMQLPVSPVSHPNVSHTHTH